MEITVDRSQLHDLIKKNRLAKIKDVFQIISEFPPNNREKSKQFVQLLTETDQIPPIYKRRFENDAEEVKNAHAKISAINYTTYYGLIITGNLTFLWFARNRIRKITNLTSLAMTLATTFFLVPLSFWNPVFKLATRNTFNTIADIEDRQQQLIAKDSTFEDLYAKLSNLTKL